MLIGTGLCERGYVMGMMLSEIGSGPRCGMGMRLSERESGPMCVNWHGAV